MKVGACISVTLVLDIKKYGHNGYIAQSTWFPKSKNQVEA